MNGFALLKEWAPQAYGIWTLVVIALLYFAREWRETRKLSSADRLARREGYATQVENLQRENRLLQTDLGSLRHEYDDYRRFCQQETEALRQHIIRLEDELSGFKRSLATQAVSVARQIGSIRKGSK